MDNAMKKILLVEDNKTMTLLVKFNLEQAGYSVIDANNGKIAYDYCKQNKPDLIISDVKMPIMSGVEFRKLILEDDRLKDIPFIFLTASAQKNEIMRGKELGVQEYLTKPFKIDVLVEKVQAFIGA